MQNKFIQSPLAYFLIQMCGYIVQLRTVGINFAIPTVSKTQ